MWSAIPSTVNESQFGTNTTQCGVFIPIDGYVFVQRWRNGMVALDGSHRMAAPRSRARARAVGTSRLTRDFPLPVSPAPSGPANSTTPERRCGNAVDVRRLRKRRGRLNRVSARRAEKTLRSSRHRVQTIPLCMRLLQCDARSRLVESKRFTCDGCPCFSDSERCACKACVRRGRRRAAKETQASRWTTHERASPRSKTKTSKASPRWRRRRRKEPSCVQTAKPSCREGRKYALAAQRRQELTTPKGCPGGTSRSSRPPCTYTRRTSGARPCRTSRASSPEAG